MAAPQNSEQILVARIIAPHGVAGMLAAESYSDNPERFRSGAVLRRCDGSEAVVEQASPHKGRLLLKLRGVNDRDTAERWRGTELFVDRLEAPPLPEGSYYHFQLLGLTVMENGQELGFVDDILEYSANDVYVLKRKDGNETLIPALKSVVKSVDLERSVMEVVLPEGL